MGSKSQAFYPTPAKWAKWRIGDELHKTFLLLWVEMFDERTLDSWQVRTCTVQSLLAEIIEAAELAKANDKYAHHLSPLVEETISTAAKDPVASQSCPFLERTLSEGRARGLKELATACEVAQSHLADHRASVTSMLRSLLATGQPKEKAKLARLALRFGTELASGGHSLEHLRSSSQFLRKAPRPFLDRFDKLVSECNTEESEHVCQFRVRSHLHPYVSGFDGFELRTSLQIDAGKRARTFYSETRAQDAIVQVTVRAADPHEARRRAAQRLGSMSATVTLFRPKVGTVVGDDPVLVTGVDGAEEVITLGASRMRHVQGATRMLALIDNVAKFSRNATASETSKFAASTEHHQLAMSANTDEIRLLNLWTALESLVVGEGLPIKNILDWIPAAMGLRNALKYLRAIGVHLRDWFKVHGFGPLVAIFPRSTTDMLSDEDLYDVLSQAPGTPAIVSIFAAIDQPLIRHRMKELNDLLTNSTLVVDAAKQHAQNVDWQIRRIYRARNKIAHQGAAPASLRHLVQHLHTYYVLTVRGLLEDAVSFDYKTFGTCFRHRAIMWDAFLRQAYKSSPTELKRWVLRPETFFRP